MNSFFELLQVSLGTRDRLSQVPSDAQWDALYEEALDQAIAGFLLCGIERLPKEQQPPHDLLLEWTVNAQVTGTQNEMRFKTCMNVCGEFLKGEFRTCVLKGQANHRYYPRDMAMRRSCGDVDVWVHPMDNSRRNYVRKTLEYVKGRHELTGLCWLHCNYDDINGVPVEVHFRPSFMNDPVHNRRFQKFFDDFESCVEKKEIDGAMISALRVEKDVVFQMNHIYRHLLDEGVGLRQVIDYYYLLKRFHTDCIGHTKSTENTEIVVALQRLGMMKFAGALMWVMKEVCGLPDECLLCQPVEKDGQFLLREIMLAGNFGQSDPRMGAVDTSSLMKRRLSQAWRRFKRNLRFLTSYPREVIWEPFARMYHFGWKLWHT